MGSADVAFIRRLLAANGLNASSESPKAKTLRPDAISSFRIYCPTNPVAPVIKQTFCSISSSPCPCAFAFPTSGYELHARLYSPIEVIVTLF